MAKSPEDYYLTALTPVADDPDSRLRHLDALEKQLERYRETATSPLARCPSLHMARFVIIDELPLQLGYTRREFLSRNYLLFAAEITGERDDFLDSLYEQAADFVVSIWKHCVGFPMELASRGGAGAYGSVYFRRYIQRHEIPTMIPFAAFPDAQVTTIRSWLDTQTKLIEFVKTHPPWNVTDQQLLNDWRVKFP
jgi:hypothetical protein